MCIERAYLAFETGRISLQLYDDRRKVLEDELRLVLRLWIRDKRIERIDYA